MVLSVSANTLHLLLRFQASNWSFSEFISFLFLKDFSFNLSLEKRILYDSLGSFKCCCQKGVHIYWVQRKVLEESLLFFLIGQCQGVVFKKHRVNLKEQCIQQIHKK